MKIKVWQPKFKVPDHILESASEFSFPKNLRKDNGVAFADVDHRKAFITDGICGWHDDQHVDSQYTLLFVLRNDTGSYVESKGEEPILDQPVGTMILFDAWHTHRLWNKKGNNCSPGVYLVLFEDMQKSTNKRECEKRMKAILNKGKS